MLKGSCLCKGYQFEIHGECTAMVDCHCSMCRKAHGSDYANFVGCADRDYQLISGEALVANYPSSKYGVRSFCMVCGSNLPTVPDSNDDGNSDVYIPAGLLDGDPGVRTSSHYFAASKAPWVTIHDNAAQHDEYPTG